MLRSSFCARAPRSAMAKVRATPSLAPRSHARSRPASVNRRAMSARTRIAVTSSEHVTVITYAASPENRGIALLLAHGAGGNQMSPFMVDYAKGLAERGIDMVTFNFVYSEQRKRLPDRNDKLEACWRAVIVAARSGALGPETA